MMNNRWKSAGEMLELTERSQKTNDKVKLIVSEILEAAETAARNGEMLLAFREHGFGSLTLRNLRSLSLVQTKVIEELRELGYIADMEVCELTLQELRSEARGESRDVFLQVEWGIPIE